MLPGRKTMRADARANRTAILAAAAEVFREHGLDATFEEVADAAGVGRATVYRHFPTREQLLGALLLVALDEIEQRSARLPDQADPLGGVLRTTVEVLAEHVPLIDTLRAHGPLPEGVLLQLRTRLAGLLQAPLEAAQANGTARQDLTVEDLRVLVAMLTVAVRRGVPHDERERALRLADAAVRP